MTEFPSASGLFRTFRRKVVGTLGALALLCVPSLHAAIYTIDNTNDFGANSLGAALAGVASDTTSVDSGAFSTLFNTPQTIVLSSSYAALTKMGGGSLTLAPAALLSVNSSSFSFLNLSGNATYTLSNLDSQSTSASAIVVNSGATLSVSNFDFDNLTLNGGTLQTSGALASAGKIFLASASSIDVSSGTTTLSGAISGAFGRLTKLGSGTLTLSGANTYGGQTAVENGILVLTGSRSAGTSNVNVFAGTLQLKGNFTLDNFISSLAPAAGLRVDGADVVTLTAGVNLSGFSKVGTGVLVLAGNNSAMPNLVEGVVSGSSAANFGGGSGNTLLNFGGGTLRATGGFTLNGSGFWSGASAIDVVNAGDTLTLNLDNTAFAGAGLKKVGAGTLVLSGSTTDISGGLTTGLEITAGTVSVASAATFGLSSGTLTLDGGTLQATASLASGQGVTIGSGGGTLSVANAADVLTINGVISGSGALTTGGAGTVLLTATNPYNGGTTIQSGTLQLGNGGTSGSVAGDIANNAALVFQRSDAVAYGGKISGTGSVSQAGSGTLTLSGANAYSGATKFNAGVMAAGSTGAFGTSVLTFNGGTMQYTAASATADYAARIKNSTSAIEIDTNGQNVTWAGAIDGSNFGGGLTKLGSGTLTLSGANAYGGLTAVENGILVLTGSQSVGNSRVNVFGGTLQLKGNFTLDNLIGSLAPAAGLRVDGTDVVTLTAGVNLSGFSKVGTGVLVLAGNNSAMPNFVEGVVSGSSAANFGGGSGNTLLNFGGGTLRATGGFTLNGSGFWSGASAIDVANAGDTLTLNLDNTAFAGAGLKKVGAGTLVLSGTTTGATPDSTTSLEIRAGTVSVNSAATFGLSSGTLTLDGGALRNTANIITSCDGTLGAGGGTFDTSGGFLTFNGNFSGTGGLTKTGNNILTLNGAQTYTGATSILAGLLKFGANGATQSALATSSIAIASGAQLIFQDSQTYAGAIKGAGNVIHEFAGTTVITGTASHTGGTTISAGAIQIGNGGTTGAITGDVSLSNGGTLAFNRSDAVTFNGVISGTGGVLQMGTGKLTLTGDSSYTSATTIAAGSFLVEGNLTGPGPVNLTGGAIGGGGSIGGSLHFGLGSGLVFDPTRTLTINGTTVTFDGFSMADIIGLDSTVALGTYALLDGPATFDFANVANFGAGNGYALGGGKYAYFQSGSLDVVVVPEPAAWVLILFAGVGLFVWHRLSAASRQA